MECNIWVGVFFPSFLIFLFSFFAWFKHFGIWCGMAGEMNYQKWKKWKNEKMKKGLLYIIAGLWNNLQHHHMGIYDCTKVIFWHITVWFYLFSIFCGEQGCSFTHITCMNFSHIYMTAITITTTHYYYPLILPTTATTTTTCFIQNRMSIKIYKKFRFTFTS